MSVYFRYGFLLARINGKTLRCARDSGRAWESYAAAVLARGGAPDMPWAREVLAPLPLPSAP